MFQKLFLDTIHVALVKLLKKKKTFTLTGGVSKLLEV